MGIVQISFENRSKFNNCFIIKKTLEPLMVKEYYQIFAKPEDKFLTKKIFPFPPCFWRCPLTNIKKFIKSTFQGKHVAAVESRGTRKLCSVNISISNSAISSMWGINLACFCTSKSNKSICFTPKPLYGIIIIT